MKYLIIIAFLLMGCNQGDYMSKIGKADGVDLVSSSVTESEATGYLGGQLLPTTWYIKNGERYHSSDSSGNISVVEATDTITVDPSESTINERHASIVHVFLGKWTYTRQSFSFETGVPLEIMFLYSPTGDTWKEVYTFNVIGDNIYEREWEIFKPDGLGGWESETSGVDQFSIVDVDFITIFPKDGEYIVFNGALYSVMSRDGIRSNNEKFKVIPDLSYGGIYEDGDLVYDEYYVYKMTYDEENQTWMRIKQRPVNKYLAVDGINTTPATSDGTMTYSVTSKEQFNVVMIDRVIGDDITYTIKKPDGTVVLDNITETINCNIMGAYGDVWAKKPTPVLIELPELIAKGGIIEFTITSEGAIELGEIVTSYIIEDGSTIKGITSTNKILQEDKVNPVGQLDRSKSIRPKVIQYKIVVERDKYLWSKAIHDKLYNNDVVILPTGLSGKALTADMVPAMVGWLKQTTYPDDGESPSIKIDMELRQKV